jgi:Spy/CpxP family protein refolding chaperone
MNVRAISLLTVAAVILAVLFSGAIGDGLAQDKGDTKKAKGTLPAGWKKLALSDKQKADIYAVMGEYKTKIKALDDQIKALKEEEHREMVKLLTDDQKKQLAAGLGLEPAKKDDKKPDSPPDKK